MGVSIAVASACPASAAAAVKPRAQFINVELDAAASPVSGGRLLVFAKQANLAEAEAFEKSEGRVTQVTEVDATGLDVTSTTVAAIDVDLFVPGTSVAVDGDANVSPQPFSQLPPGDYYVQAVLDGNRNYAYLGRGAGDWVSEVVKLHLPASHAPTVRLTRALPEHDPWNHEAAPAEVRQATEAARPHAHAIDYASRTLSTFWGRPIMMKGWVLTPPGYDAKAGATYPTVYYTHGFGKNTAAMVGPLASVHAAMADGSMPPMIWVLLDQSSATGTHEFADSVNNGPWGTALTTELIPHLESGYRMDAKASGRFLNGHSSGGWAALWLQTQYPALFGGCWATAPDPSDFHDFNGVDLYAPQANVFRKADGSARPLVRDQGEVLATFEQFAKLERVLGSYGGQLRSLEWVFSPRGPDGAPQAVFDRDTGRVDPDVVAYWREHYDIGYLTARDWPMLRPHLDGKVRLIVGTEDNFYLEGAAYRLKAVFDALNAKSDFRFVPGKTHFDLYYQGDDKLALLKQIAWEMYAVARPMSA